MERLSGDERRGNVAKAFPGVRLRIAERCRRALIGVVAAMLVGCGQSQHPLDTPSAVLQPNSTQYMVLHSFGGSGDGKTLFAGLTKVKGKLYGTTVFGGASDQGTVFSLAPSGKETVLYSFRLGSGDGEKPYGTLIGIKGILFGTTVYGGTAGDGTVFSISRSGKEVVLHSFGGSGDGYLPYAGLISIGKTLYGTTSGGGESNDGTVFRITASGKENVLYSFLGTPDGAEPYASLLDVKGKLWGTTEYGGDADGQGTVFSITLKGKEAAIHSFGPYFYGDGERPYANLLDVNGTLYGTTIRGGAYNWGSVFTVTTAGQENVLYSFGRSTEDGEEPTASLVDVSGTLYGTTSMGGANGEGTVFAITPSGSEAVLHSFGGTGDGEYPQAALLNVGGTLYGTTESGGTYGAGTAFSIAP